MKVTKEKFDDYRLVQFSGVTNMFAVNIVMELSGLSKDEYLDIMEHYCEYTKKFGKYSEGTWQTANYKVYLIYN